MTSLAKLTFKLANNEITEIRSFPILGSEHCAVVLLHLDVYLRLELMFRAKKNIL